MWPYYKFNKDAKMPLGVCVCVCVQASVTDLKILLQCARNTVECIHFTFAPVCAFVVCVTQACTDPVAGVL